MKIISGGQCGVDQSALSAAKACGLKTGGTAAKGWLTEDGPAPWLADYGLVECGQEGYPPRTEKNVADADATLLLVCGSAGYDSPGSRLVMRLAREYDKPLITIDMERLLPAEAASLIPDDVAVLNVAGNRESRMPGVGVKAKAFLTEMFRRMQEQEEIN